MKSEFLHSAFTKNLMESNECSPVGHLAKSAGEEFSGIVKAIFDSASREDPTMPMMEPASILLTCLAQAFAVPSFQLLIRLDPVDAANTVLLTYAYVLQDLEDELL